MKHLTIRLTVIVLSMPLVSTAVKAQDKPLPSVNQGSVRQEPLKDSVKSGESELSKLVKTLMASGADYKFVNGFAQAIGLDQERPAKRVFEAAGAETRLCQIIYAVDETGNQRPICVYFSKDKTTKLNSVERFYRVSLDGQLEKVITLSNKVDENGKALREGRSRVEEDLTSSDIKKTFKAEMAFWIKDWVKKQQKLDAKKTTASATKSGAVAAASATPAQATP